MNARVTTVGVLPELPQEPEVAEGAPSGPAASRRVYLGDWLEIPVYDFAVLAAGQVIEGPAIVESETTTALLRPGDRATVTAHRWLDVSVPV